MNTSHITVIIQGHIYEGLTPEVIHSVKRHLPQARVILSTCDSEVPDSVRGYDRLIVSPDPGSYAYPHRPEIRPNNINRQLVNTNAALQEVETPYVMKLRSDFVLTGSSFLHYFELYPGAETAYRVFGHKILACCYFTRHMRKGLPYPYHLSDLVFFGCTEDMRKLYNVPLMSRDEAYWNPQDLHQYRYTPEQHIFIHCLRKNGFSADCKFYNDRRPVNIEQTERYFASNFILLNFEQFNLKCTKDTFSARHHPKDFMNCYTHYDWLQLYKTYVDSSQDIPAEDEERKQFSRFYRVYKKYHLIANLLVIPLCPFRLTRRKLRTGIMKLLLR